MKTIDEALSNQIQAVLSSPSAIPFDGFEKEARLAAIMYVNGFEIPEKNPYVFQRILAFVINHSGISYQELGASVPLSLVTVNEHIMLRKWVDEAVAKKISGDSRRIVNRYRNKSEPPCPICGRTGSEHKRCDDGMLECPQ